MPSAVPLKLILKFRNHRWVLSAKQVMQYTYSLLTSCNFTKNVFRCFLTVAPRFRELFLTIVEHLEMTAFETYVCQENSQDYELKVCCYCG